ncbi:sulfate/molybdate ABC transporter ATP-binding protein [Alicyclobacillus acidoterrestris]|uniref:Carnitine transport ATP-binding protein OpuCA n=1 Tax=Alicyclobacillus acidoterrestris (strain ATCC 49025 / DSM 3922 / CIP 106132 / NCIMB 13137 / GD3B) TaxID=1356854 RepID=T0D2C3_ALIAG|nr:ABC transporter ATP-binding protein [Alicyclobacillus acidoterrestris]EPZ45732.1 hypothetical protein N007_08120 [Alicyclobacillus acidoterrestris ATCC 49025]UNO49994.1 ABC transporter ATP-binding protein [Alicyclobacillus acidoterrestris]
MSIELRHIAKSYTGEALALDDVSLQVKEGEMIGFLGPSGSGKTTLLRIIAGLEKQSAGEVLIGGKVVDELPPQKRKVGVVFQNYALFKHMTVYENIAFGLKVQKQSKKHIHMRVMELLKYVRLEGLENRYPQQLSGGQAQRVALARALAPKPKILLLDEPFAAIDTKVRRELRQWVRDVHDDIGITSIFVTHDQEEALEIADRVLVMNRGKIEQFGTPKEVYEAPSSLFVANFVGEANHIYGKTVGNRVAIGEISVDVPDKPDGTNVHVVIRPKDIRIREILSDDDVTGEIVRVSYKGDFYGVDIATKDLRLHVYVPKEQDYLLEIGRNVAYELTDFKLFEERPMSIASEVNPYSIEIRKSS